MGYHSKFSYPHTSHTTDLPFCLKGIDMAVYEALTALSLKPVLCAVMHDPMDHYYGPRYSDDDDFSTVLIRMQPLEADDAGGSDDCDVELRNMFRGMKYVEHDDVTWINDPERPLNEQAQVAHMVVRSLPSRPRMEKKGGADRLGCF
jgi:hypothetical protein